METEKTDSSARDGVEDNQGPDNRGEMVRGMGDGEEETPMEQPPANQREVGDGKEDEDDDDQNKDARHRSGNPEELKDDVKSTTGSRSDSVPGDERPSVVPAVADDEDSGRNSQTAATDAEKFDEVKKGATTDDGHVEGREVEKQMNLRENNVSSATAILGSRDEEGSKPQEEFDRDRTETGSFTVDRKQLTTSTSDYTVPLRQSRLPVFRSAHAHVQCLQAPRAIRDSDPGKHVSRFPPRLIRLATVTMAPKAKPATPVPSLYYEEPRRPRKVITWDQANNARPPLRVDMEGPTPWSYSPRNKPLYETNAPSWTFGSRCSPERDGGSRTSWAKTWFQSPHVWHNKVDFGSDSRWPPPNAYTKTSLLGPRQRTMPEYPAFSMGRKGDFSYVKPGAEKEPSPMEYDRLASDRLMYTRHPSFSHQFRREGTILWSPAEDTPGPGAYSPTTTCNRPHKPAFSIKGIRREKSHILGPYSTF